MLYIVAHVHDANETFDVLPIAWGSDISVLSPSRSHLPLSASITTPIITSIACEAEERGWARVATTRRCAPRLRKEVGLERGRRRDIACRG